MTRKAGERAEDSAVLRDLLDAGTEVVCLVGKAWDLHVTEALRTDLDEGVAMVRDSVAFLRAQGRRVFFDAEHFFDGYRQRSGASRWRVLGGGRGGRRRAARCCATRTAACCRSTSPRSSSEVDEQASAPLGIHVHNDAGCAVANSLIAVDAGVFQVQGTMNGYGERTGNADLIPIAADLMLKMGAPDACPSGAVEHLTELAHYVAEIANVAPDARQPYAGRYAFTHKAGLHTSGVARLSRGLRARGARDRGQPSRRGGLATGRRRDAPDEGGGVRRRPRRRRRSRPLVDLIKEREARGLHVRRRRGLAGAADAPAPRLAQDFFRDRELPAHVEERWDDERRSPRPPSRSSRRASATSRSAEGAGPVGALDNALRKALSNEYPRAGRHGLEDFRVRVLGETIGTGAVVRVLIDTSNGEREWTTVGVSENILEASWEALVEAYTFGLLHPRERAED